VMSQELTSTNQAFVAYAIAAGIRLIRVIPDDWVAFCLDNHDGQASAVLGLWRDDHAIINAKQYASAMRLVKKLTNQSRTNTAPTREGQTNHEQHGTSD
jgi:hypothetical protein